VLDGLEQELVGQPPAEAANRLRVRAEAFNLRSREHVERIAEYGANLIADGDRVMAYDYSSTVNRVLQRAAEQGKRLHIVIPESRSLDGGAPILREVREWGHGVQFTVDAAMGQEMKTCQSVWVGVESLTADGGFWTTVGTCSAAILARYHRVRLYVPTELIKFDLRSLEGHLRKIERRALVHLFPHLRQELGREGIGAACDDLEYTPAELITAYITENGVVPPAAVPGLARKALRLGEEEKP